MLSENRVAIFVRESHRSRDQRSTQESRCWAFADDLGTVVRVYREEAIGVSRDRVGLAQAIVDAERGGFETLITADLSRFSRSAPEARFWVRRFTAAGVNVLFACAQEEGA